MVAVTGAAVTLNFWVTGAAAFQSALPVWDAVTLQVPVSTRWIRCPSTMVHGPVAVRLTGRPEEALAPASKSGVPRVFLLIAGNVIDWWPLRDRERARHVGRRVCSGRHRPGGP